MDSEKRRFALGLLLAWTPWIPTLIGLSVLLRGISSSKATGLAAAAGGISESLILWGFVSMVACQIVAMVWLFRSFSREHVLRSVVSMISIGTCVIMLAMMSGYAWVVWFFARR